MKKVLLVQFRTDVSLEHEVACVCDKLNISEGNLKIVRPIEETVEQDPQKLLANVSQVILSGSGQFNITQNPPELQKAFKEVEPLINYIIENDFPTFAICLSFQYLGKKLGCKLLREPSRAEGDAVDVYTTPAAEQDKILKNTPKKFKALTGHSESVEDLNKDMVLLATNDVCPAQAFRYKENIYAVQFHPELNLEDIVYRWKLYPIYIKGKNLEEMKSKLADAPEATKIFRNFFEFYKN